MAVARLSGNGQLDTTFGNQGYTEIRFGSYGAQLTSLAVDPSGDYIAGGATLTGSNGSLTIDFALTELAGSSDPPDALPETADVLALPVTAMGVIGLFVMARRRKIARRRCPISKGSQVGRLWPEATDRVKSVLPA